LTTPETTENSTPVAEAPAEHIHDENCDHSHDHDHGPSLNPECTREIEVSAPAADVDAAFAAVVRDIRRHARIPGFRAGKTPESLIRSRFAKDIRQQVLESLVSERFRQALDAQQLKPVSQPQLRELVLNEGAPLSFKAAFEILPTLDVTGYDSITVEKPDTTLSEDEYQAELVRILDQHATIEPVTDARPLVAGDLAEISFTGAIKDIAQTVTADGLESKSDEQPISGNEVLIELGGRNTLPAFTDALTGKKPGDELAFEVDYPADFGERRLAGKTVNYDVKIAAIKRRIRPERNADLAKQLGQHDSFEDFEKQLREHLVETKKNGILRGAQDKMIAALAAKFTFPVPESLVQQQIDERLERGLRALAQQGMTAEAMRQLDFSRLRVAQRDSALEEVKASLILDRIAELEKVEVAQDDLDRELLMLSLQSRQPLQEMKDQLVKDGTLDRIKKQLLRERTVTALYTRLSS